MTVMKLLKFFLGLERHGKIAQNSVIKECIALRKPLRTKRVPILLTLQKYLLIGIRDRMKIRKFPWFFTSHILSFGQAAPQVLHRRIWRMCAPEQGQDADINDKHYQTSH